MSDQELLTELTDGVLTLTMNRPEKYNAISPALLASLSEGLEQAKSDDVRAVILTGAGKSFGSGADLSAVNEAGDRDRLDFDSINAFSRGLCALPKPVIAAARGPVAGVSVSFALASDILLLSENAYLLLAFTRIGLMPDGGATALVAASAGRHRAMKLALLAEKLPAASALAEGLATEVVADDQLDARALELATKLAKGPTRAYAATKAAINASTLAELDAALDRELEAQEHLLESADFAEGTVAFREKRPANFTGE